MKKLKIMKDMLPIIKTVAIELAESPKYFTETTGTVKVLIKIPPYAHKKLMNKTKRKISFFKNFIDGDNELFFLSLFGFF